MTFGKLILGNPSKAKLLNAMEVPAPVLPPIATVWTPNSLWLMWLELTDDSVFEFETTEPTFELCGVPISLIFEVYLIL